jgi:hypothetical protein
MTFPLAGVSPAGAIKRDKSAAEIKITSIPSVQFNTKHMQFFVALATLAYAGPGPTPNRTYTLLEGNRDKLLFQPYSSSQKLLVAQGLANLFAVYGNRFKKIESYDAEYKDRFGVSIDPVPRSRALTLQAANWTDTQFHYAYNDLFQSLRDLHTNYIMPAPHACYSFLQGASFTLVTNRTLIVSGFALQPEVQALTKDAISKMALGDILLTINNKTFQQFQTEVKWSHGGNTESGLLRRSLAWLSSRSGRYSKAPLEKDVLYQFQSAKDGKKYQVTMPWILSQRDDCLSSYKSFASGAAAKSSSVPSAASIDRVRDINSSKLKQVVKKINQPSMVALGLEEYKESFALTPEDSKVIFTPTAEPGIQWTIFEPEGRNLGVVSLADFTPVGGDSGATLLVRNLLLNQLKDTKSLLLGIFSLVLIT